MYNFISTFEELNKLYEEVDTKKVHEEELSEAADEEVEIEIEDDEAGPEVEEAEEAKESEEASEADEEATEEEPVETHFVLECTKCGALALKVAEEANMVDLEETCQFCEESEGYKIIGTMLPYAEDAELEELFDVKLDARGFGGSGNKVSVLGGRLPESLDEEEAVEEGLLNLDMPISANVNVKADGNKVPVLNTGI